MKAWWILALVLFTVGCGSHKVVPVVQGKTAEQWAQVVETSDKTDTRTNALIHIFDICKADPSEVPQLSKCLKINHPDVQMITIRYLQDLGKKAQPALPDLKALVGNEETTPGVKAAAEKALEEIAPSEDLAPGAAPMK